jgi:EAL domain-containing protein (putative c-di-GMP-specific phosphodiesterase class I)
MGCNTYQGYLFSKPLPRIDFEAIATGDTGTELRAAIFE